MLLSSTPSTLGGLLMETHAVLPPGANTGKHAFLELNGDLILLTTGSNPVEAYRVSLQQETPELLATSTLNGATLDTVGNRHFLYSYESGDDCNPYCLRISEFDGQFRDLVRLEDYSHTQPKFFIPTTEFCIGDCISFLDVAGSRHVTVNLATQRVQSNEETGAFQPGTGVHMGDRLLLMGGGFASGVSRNLTVYEDGFSVEPDWLPETMFAGSAASDGETIIWANPYDENDQPMTEIWVRSSSWNILADSKLVQMGIAFAGQYLAFGGYDQLNGTWNHKIYTIDLNNQVPSVSISIPSSVRVNEPVQLSAQVTDLDDSEHLISWDFGDGSIGEGESLVHSFAEVGEFNVVATATDEEGAQGVASSVIVVNSAPQSASSSSASQSASSSSSASSSRPPNMPPALQIDALVENFTAELKATVSDPDGDTVTVVWNFGDGSAGSGEIVRHTFAPGEYTISATADDGLHTTTKWTDLKIDLSAAPEVTITGPAVGAEGDLLTWISDVPVSWKIDEAIGVGDRFEWRAKAGNFVLVATGRDQFGQETVVQLNIEVFRREVWPESPPTLEEEGEDTPTAFFVWIPFLIALLFRRRQG